MHMKRWYCFLSPLSACDIVSLACFTNLLALKVNESPAQRTPTDNINFTLCNLYVKAPASYTEVVFHLRSRGGHWPSYLLLSILSSGNVSNTKTHDSQPGYTSKHAKLDYSRLLCKTLREKLDARPHSIAIRPFRPSHNNH